MQHSSSVPAAGSRGVCIVSQRVADVVDCAQITASGFKLRLSDTCVPDLLISGSGTTIAVVELNASLSLEELERQGIWDRCTSRIHTAVVNQHSVTGSGGPLSTYCHEHTLLFAGLTRFTRRSFLLLWCSSTAATLPLAI